MTNTCGWRLLLVWAEPGSGGSDPQTPHWVGYALPTDLTCGVGSGFDR